MFFSCKNDKLIVVTLRNLFLYLYDKFWRSQISKNYFRFKSNSRRHFYSWKILLFFQTPFPIFIYILVLTPTIVCTCARICSVSPARGALFDHPLLLSSARFSPPTLFCRSRARGVKSAPTGKVTVTTCWNFYDRFCGGKKNQTLIFENLVRKII